MVEVKKALPLFCTCTIADEDPLVGEAAARAKWLELDKKLTSDASRVKAQDFTPVGMFKWLLSKEQAAAFTTAYDAMRLRVGASSGATSSYVPTKKGAKVASDTKGLVKRLFKKR